MTWYVKTIRSGARDAEGNLPPEVWEEGLVCPTLNAFDNGGDSRSTVLIFYGNRVDDIRIQKAVINTLQARMGTGGNNMPMVAYPIQGTTIGRSDTAGPQGKGFGDAEDPMYTIDTVGGNAVAMAGNFELYDFPKEEVSPSLNARRAKDTLTYGDASVVRRLSPRECERLQGFPDDWTASQSDSQRYKQMGNAVAVPVVQWIINRLVAVNDANNG